MQNWNPEKNDKNKWCMDFSNPADNKYINLDELNKKEEDREYYKSFESVEPDWGSIFKTKNLLKMAKYALVVMNLYKMMVAVFIATEMANNAYLHKSDRAVPGFAPIAIAIIIDRKNINERPKPKITNQIEDIIATRHYEQIPELISRFLDSKDRQSLEGLLIQLLFQEDIDNIKEDYRNYPSIFIKSILKEGWTGYNNLSYSQIIREFIARESLTDHPLYLENDEAEILESALITEAVNSETEVSKKVEDYSFSPYFKKPVKPFFASHYLIIGHN